MARDEAVVDNGFLFMGLALARAVDAKSGGTEEEDWESDEVLGGCEERDE